MPLTGENQIIGSQCNSFIQLGLSETSSIDMNVTSYDIANTANLENIVDKILTKNTQIVLGPLYSASTKTVAEMIKLKTTPNDRPTILTLSNDPLLVDDNLFVFGHVPLAQNKRIVEYFLSKNYKHFISLLPSSQYSKSLVSLMQDMIWKQHAIFSRSSFYKSLDPHSIEQAIQEVDDIVDRLNEMDEIENKPVIYISDDPQNLHIIFTSLIAHQLDKKAKIIGDNRIDIEYPGNLDITFTGSVHAINSPIKAAAANLGVNHILFLHSIAYDLGKMVGSYIKESFHKDSFLARIKGKDQYFGTSGLIHFEDNIAIREYDIINRINQTLHHESSSALPNHSSSALY